MDFLQRFQEAKRSIHENYYIPYEMLYGLLEIGETGEECPTSFYQELDFSFHRWKNYAENWLDRLMLGDVNGNILEEVMELNGFISMNHQALYNIIILHDRKFSQSKLYISWRWKLELPLLDKLILFIIDSGNFVPSQASRKSLSLPAEYLRPSTICLDDLFHNSIIEEGDESESQSKKSSIQLSSSMVKRIVQDNSRRISLLPQQKSGILSRFSLFSFLSAPRSESYFVNDSTVTQHLITSENLISVIVLLSRQLPTKSGVNLPSSASLMTSFYFDNSNYDAYRHCLGPGILQSYGQAISLQCNKLDPEKVEVHLSSHYRENQLLSDKFQIKLDDVTAFLQGEPVAFSPENKGGMCSQVQSLLRQKGYYPRMKSTYTQITFQSYAHDHIQITIKFNYRFYNLHSHDASSNTPIYLDWVHDPSRYTARDHLSFPWGVLEINLKEPFASTPPPFIEDLLNSSMLFQPHLSSEFFSIYSHALYSFLSLENNTHPAITSPITATGVTGVTGSSPSFQQIPCPSWWNELNQMTNDPIASLQSTQRSPEHWFARLIHNLLSLNSNYISSIDMDKERKKSFQKICFSCERTFLSWLGSASYAVTLGVLVSKEPGARIAGGLLVLGGVVIVVYAVISYILRLQAIDKIKIITENVHFYDIYGPVGLSIFISASWTISWLILIGVIQL